MLTESERSHYRLWEGIYGKPEPQPGIKPLFAEWYSFPNGAKFRCERHYEDTGDGMRFVGLEPIARIWAPEEELEWLKEKGLIQPMVVTECSTEIVNGITKVSIRGLLQKPRYGFKRAEIEFETDDDCEIKIGDTVSIPYDGPPSNLKPDDYFWFYPGNCSYCGKPLNIPEYGCGYCTKVTEVKFRDKPPKCCSLGAVEWNEEEGINQCKVCGKMLFSGRKPQPNLDI